VPDVKVTLNRLENAVVRIEAYACRLAALAILE
jgi:hypothetical protein